MLLNNSRSCDPIQGQGHRGPKVAKMADFNLLTSSSGMCVIKRLLVYSDTPRQYLNFVWADF